MVTKQSPIRRHLTSRKLKTAGRYTFFLTMAVLTVILWTASSYHTFVCTSSVKVSVTEVQGHRVRDLVNEPASSSKPSMPSDGERSPSFSTNISQMSTVYRHSFRSNTPLEDLPLILKSRYFLPRPRVVSPLVTKYLLEPEGLCDGPEAPPFLLTFIPSVTTNVGMRSAIREGWGSVVRGSWPRARHLPAVKIVFVFGRSGHEEELAILRRENEVWRDILYADFHDTYRNLTVKVMTSLHFAATRCPAADFVLKVDEDTFVNVPYLVEFIKYHRKELARAMVGYANNRPVSVRLGRWAVDAEAYPLPIFPKYLFGHSYLIESSLLSELVDLSKYMPFVPVEDATVTGILARVLNVTRLHSSLFAFGKRGNSCSIVKNSKVTMTLVTEASHRLIWQAVESGQCSYTLLSPSKQEEVTVADEHSEWTVLDFQVARESSSR